MNSTANGSGPPATGLRAVLRRVRGRPTSDGAGVRLSRVIGHGALEDLDPFLLLDEFGTDRPEDYIAGFPDHPHRGFETVTYMLEGRMRHRDNRGHEGVLGPGGVQWMTAGRGIIHSEMPEQQQGRMRGFQLWINLPARDKLTAPRYQEFAPAAIPVMELGGGASGEARVKLIAGRVGALQGPISQPATDPLYLDVVLSAGRAFEAAVPAGHAAFAYVYEGALQIGSGAAGHVAAAELAVLGPGDRVRLQALGSTGRAILVAGRPLGEPVARHGPFVMNTRAEILQAFDDLRSGRFGEP
jgi:redox-sensitive bicupin YhaK (pirin superfamily)